MVNSASNRRAWEISTRTYIVCPKCHPYPYMMNKAVGRIESCAMEEIDPHEGWRRFRAMTCPTCKSPLSLFENPPRQEAQ